MNIINISSTVLSVVSGCLSIFDKRRVPASVCGLWWNMSDWHYIFHQDVEHFYRKKNCVGVGSCQSAISN